MNITPQLQTLPLATVVNPQTDTLRRENNHREIITKPEATAHAAAEKGLASEKDKQKSTAQQNESYDFSALRKKAEEDDTTVNDSSAKSEQENKEKQQQSGKEEREELLDNQLISQLKQRDAEVKAHEQAHMAVGGAVTGSATYSYDVGPDGKRYAVSGEVSVDLSPVPGDPQATIAKMKDVHAAALAPADPSSQDIRVAAKATELILEAQAELFVQKTSREPSSEKSKTNIESNEAVYTIDDSLADDDLESKQLSEEFDNIMASTLQSQESFTRSITNDVSERTVRIESYYTSINQAYEKPPRNQFELTA